MRFGVAVCDLCCSGPAEIEDRISVEGTNEAWDVCTKCINKPFRRPKPSDRAKALARMGELLIQRGTELLKG